MRRYALIAMVSPELRDETAPLEAAAQVCGTAHQFDLYCRTL